MSEGKGDNKVNWLIVLAGLLTALGMPVIFPDLVRRYLDKVSTSTEVSKDDSYKSKYDSLLVVNKNLLAKGGSNNPDPKGAGTDKKNPLARGRSDEHYIEIMDVDGDVATKQVIVNFTVTATKRNLHEPLNMADTFAMANGNPYLANHGELGLGRGEGTGGYTDYVHLIKDTPMNASLTFINVPSSVQEFKPIRIKIGSEEVDIPKTSISWK